MYDRQTKLHCLLNHMHALDEHILISPSISSWLTGGKRFVSSSRMLSNILYMTL